MASEAGNESPIPDIKPDIESALAAAREREDLPGFLRILAVGRVVVPQLQPVHEAGGWRLPTVEKDGTRYVLAFSSQQRLAESGVETVETITMTGKQLGEAWPGEDDLWLVINLGSDNGVTLPPESVRALPSARPDG